MTRPSQQNGRHGGLTKSFSVDEARLLLRHLDDGPLHRTAVELLANPSTNRRQAVGRLVRQQLLGDQPNGPVTPLARCLADPRLSPKDAAALCGVLYDAHTPLAREAVQNLLLPRLDDEDVAPLTVSDWRSFLAERLKPMTADMADRTRSTLVAMLRKFGWLAAGPLGRPGVTAPYDVVPYQGRAEIFLAALVIDYAALRTSSRGLAYVLGDQGPRALLPVSRAFATYALQSGEAAGLLKLTQVGADQDVVVGHADPIGRLAKMVGDHGAG